MRKQQQAIIKPSSFPVHDPLRSLPQLRLDDSRAQVLAYFKNSWALTEMLFSGLANEEAFYIRPYHQLRHPLIFYYGHPVTLYVNKLRVAGLLHQPVNAPLEKLFETGVDEMRWDDLHDGEQHIWPPVEAVRAYRAQVYALICELIETHPLLEPQHLPMTQQSPLWALVMGFEHERIHLETSSVLMRELPIAYVRKPEGWPDFMSLGKESVAPPIDNPMIAVDACNVTMGKPDDYPSFGWDNEYGHETRRVRPFKASSQLISNAEFHAFVADGGYVNERFWSHEGWAWRGFRNIKHPTFWVALGPAGLHHYQLRTIFETVDMQWDWPVCVNFHEAKAYCAWKSEQENAAMPYRLLTEAEHHAIRSDRGDYNFGLASGGESPVNAFSANAKGFHDVFGNVWQWCEDHFHPLAGAKPHPYYDDFSVPCYDGEHQMMLGGSFISTGDEASAFARFHFRAHFFQHAGFRVVQSNDGNAASDAKLISRDGQLAYETGEMLGKYVLMHWGSEAEIYEKEFAGLYPQVAHLPLACAALIKRFASGFDNALDLGCAVARSSFEMARDFKRVVGIDYSHEFIEAAQTLKHNGELTYHRKEQGKQFTKLIARVDEAIDRSRLHFEQGDACKLPLHLKAFDAVLLANVLCRLPDPAACLERMQGVNALVKPGGVLVMTTPFSWLADYTPEPRWLNGVEDIKQILTEFELIHQEELPFVIREHRRKFEYIITHASVWRRK